MRSTHATRLAAATLLLLFAGAAAGEARDATGDDRLAATIAELRDPETRAAARQRWIDLGPLALDVLLPYLLDTGGEAMVRWTAINVQGEIRDRRALPVLAVIVARDPDPRLRMEAQRVLEKYPDPSPAIDELRGELTAEEPAVRWNAAVALSFFGVAEGVPILHQGVLSPDPIQRWQALDALGRVHDSTTARVVAPLLVSPEVEDRQELILTLGRLGGPEAFLMLAGALGDDAAAVRWRACMVLGTVGNVRAIPPLRRLLASELDPQVVKHAREALIKLEALL